MRFRSEIFRKIARRKALFEPCFCSREITAGGFLGWLPEAFFCCFFREFFRQHLYTGKEDFLQVDSALDAFVLPIQGYSVRNAYIADFTTH